VTSPHPSHITRLPGSPSKLGIQSCHLRTCCCRTTTSKSETHGCLHWEMQGLQSDDGSAARVCDGGRHVQYNPSQCAAIASAFVFQLTARRRPRAERHPAGHLEAVNTALLGNGESVVALPRPCPPHPDRSSRRIRKFLLGRTSQARQGLRLPGSLPRFRAVGAGCDSPVRGFHAFQPTTPQDPVPGAAAPHPRIRDFWPRDEATAGRGPDVQILAVCVLLPSTRLTTAAGMHAERLQDGLRHTLEFLISAVLRGDPRGGLCRPGRFFSGCSRGLRRHDLRWRKPGWPD